MKPITAIAMLCLGVAVHARASIDATQLVADARAQIGVTVTYDPAYQKLKHPGGDVPT